MYFEIGTPRKLNSLSTKPPELAELKKKYQIAVIDDEPFQKVNALRNHGFNILELGDVKTVGQAADFAIIVCDIRGVGIALGSSLEGAHLVAELRKAYPDKYLISYSGAQYDISYNESLKSVDVSLSKDARTEDWVSALEQGLRNVGSPRERWMRFRRHLLENAGADLHEVFKLEQSFIAAIEKGNASLLNPRHISGGTREIVTTFAKVALVQLVKAAVT